jgi:hypothetical protein
MPQHARNTPRKHLSRFFWLITAGFVLNLLISWGLLTIPRWTAAANIRTLQARNTNIEDGYDSVYFAQRQWFGILERQYHLTRRGRSQPIPKRISMYWTWHPFEPTSNAISTANSLFDDFKPVNPDNAIISSTRVGFPALALQAETLIDDSTSLPNKTLVTDTRSGFITRVDAAIANYKPGVWSHAQHLLFPYRPIWIGILINTIFYTLCILIAAWLLRSIRHARRMHRGCCPYCTYELHHDFRNGCPECGWRRNATDSSS